MSRASLRRKGPRSGLSREASERAGLGESGSFFLRSGEGLAREGEGDGGFFGRGEGVLRLAESDLCGVWLSGTEIRRGGASGGVLTDTKPGMVTELAIQMVMEEEKKMNKWRNRKLGSDSDRGLKDKKVGTCEFQFH